MKRAGLLLLGIFLCASLSARADDWTKTYALTGTPDLRVETSDADIHVDTWDRNTIEAKISTTHYKIGDDGVRVTERQNGNQVSLDVRMPHHAFNIQIGMHSNRVLIDVHMPRNGNVDLRTEDGAIRLDNLKGAMALNTGDGSIEASGLDGGLRAHTSDGHIRADGRFDTLDISTGDGRVEATAMAGSKAQSTWNLRTSDGSVELALPSDFAADLDLRTSDGHVSVDFPVTVQGHISENSIYGKVNGGGNLVTVRTADGSIRVRKT
jgi:DUF4097 and DUF4098 domain-containing protein YvlB